jgi:hypothetical protein
LAQSPAASSKKAALPASAERQPGYLRNGRSLKKSNFGFAIFEHKPGKRPSLK